MAENLDEVAERLRDGRLVRTGPSREVVMRASMRPRPGEVLPDPAVIEEVEPGEYADTWIVRVRDLAERRPSN